MLDILKAAGDCGLPIPDYRYVGMGANRFYDFLLIHKYLGIKNMVSLEHDKTMYERALYNNPYYFIDVQNTSTADYVSAPQPDEPSIFWLDYDGGLSENITNDIMTLAPKMQAGDFFFVTVAAGSPGFLNKLNSKERLSWLQDSLGDFAGEVKIEDVQNSAFPKAVHKVLFAAFKNAFAVRRDADFAPLVQIEYKDSYPMVTVGGALLTSGQKTSLVKKLESTTPFLECDEPSPYKILPLHLTDQERALFDRAVTAKTKRSRERNLLTKFGFEEDELNTYRELLRYLPRYVETMI